MKVGIDIMGGDFAPQAPLEGVSLFVQDMPGSIELVLIGDEHIISEYLRTNNIDDKNISVIGSTQVIEMSDSPTKGFTQKPDSSIAKGFYLLKTGEIDVFMSAGNTGAMLVGAMYTIKAIEGVMRPTITSIVPKVDGSYGILLDVGANSDCKQDVLNQFGILGSLYAKYVYNIEKPKVALLNIGSEKEKGNLVTQAAYPLMETNDKINFVGNVEGYDLFSEKADVIVCDGFAGNIVLKTAQGVRKIMKKRGLNDPYFETWNYENYGGTPILGVNKPVIIGHGVSSALAFKNMINLGINVTESDLCNKIKSAFNS